jgi:NAD(P)-dependent dehydrogenase (short-subunit alcohol dehydrogenase family)
MLLQLQGELSRPIYLFRRESLRGKICRAAARLGKLAVCLAREEAPPKGQEALAAANFQNIKAAAADLAAIWSELSSFRASFEALNATLLALVSFPCLFILTVC